MSSMGRATTASRTLRQELFQTVISRLPEEHLRSRAGEPLPEELLRLKTSSGSAWHFSMVNDERRSIAYDNAIKSAVQNATRRNGGRAPTVLDIGAGTGLLAMMAIRAGAAHVHTVEMTPAMAVVAKMNIERNGMAGRVTVLSMLSTDIQIGVHMPVRADILVSEIIDLAVVGEDMLPTYEDALKRLTTPTAIVLPRRATLGGVLVESKSLRKNGGPVANAAPGLDLSAAKVLINPDYELLNREPNDTFGNIGLDDMTILSEPVQLASWDFRFPVTDTRRHTQEVIVNRTGTVDALVFWFDFWVDDNNLLSTNPMSGQRVYLHWTRGVRHMRGADNIAVKQGDTPCMLTGVAPVSVWFHVRHNCQDLNDDQTVLLDPVQTYRQNGVGITTYLESAEWLEINDDLWNSAMRSGIKQAIETTGGELVIAMHNDVIPIPAMYAAAQRASTVVSAQESESMAAASLTVAANGLQDAITIVPELTTWVNDNVQNIAKVGGIKLLVSNVFARHAGTIKVPETHAMHLFQKLVLDLLGSRLLAPNAVVIPSQYALRITLVESLFLWESSGFVNSTVGLDVSALNALSSNSLSRVPSFPRNPAFTAVSDTHVMHEIDFNDRTIDVETAKKAHEHLTHALRFAISRDATAHAFVVTSGYALGVHEELRWDLGNDFYLLLDSPIKVTAGQHVSFTATQLQGYWFMQPNE